MLPPFRHSKVSFVSSTLIALKRYLLLKYNIAEFNKFKVINIYLSHEPPIVSQEILILLQMRCMEETVNVMMKSAGNIPDGMTNCIGLSMGWSYKAWQAVATISRELRFAASPLICCGKSQFVYDPDAFDFL